MTSAVSVRRSNKTTMKLSIVRIGILFTFLMVLFMFGMILNAFAKSDDSSVAHTAKPAVQEHVVRVHEGDTLWSIAKRFAPPSDDIRSYIHKIKKENNLGSADLQIGQTLRLPN